MVLTLLGLLYSVSMVIYAYLAESGESAKWLIAIFGVISVMLLIVLAIERLVVFLIYKIAPEVTKDDLQSQKEPNTAAANATKDGYSSLTIAIYASQIIAILCVGFCYIAFTNQPVYKLTITENVKCFAVYQGEKEEAQNFILQFLHGNKSEKITENAKIIFDNTDKIDREIETIANFEYGGESDFSEVYKVKDTSIAVRVHTIGNYHLTQQDTLQFIAQLQKLRN